MMGGKTDYCPEHTVSLCEGIAARGAAAGVAVTCSPTVGGPADTVDDVVSDGEVESAVKAADVVVIAVGGIFGHEAADRTNISLPADQINLIKTTAATAAAAKVTVVLLVVNGDPIALDGIKDAIGTIVDVFEGGQSAGTAAAQILFGDYSPSGMMPFTTYPDDFVTKVAMSDMSMRPNATTGSPGRTYRFYAEAPLWPFGFGLSYTTWGYTWAAVPGQQQPAATLHGGGGGLQFTVELSNTGGTDSAKTVQLYIRQTNVADAPRRQLAALAKVFVPAGKTVSVPLNTSAYGNICSFCVVAEDGSSSVPVGTAYTVSIGDGNTDYFAGYTITAV